MTWDRLDVDLAKLQQKADLTAAMTKRYPNRLPKTIQNWVSQIWPFAHEMIKGDLVVLPLKSQPAIQIAEITGDYHFEPSGPDPYFHWRPVKWIAEAVPPRSFRQRLALYLRRVSDHLPCAAQQRRAAYRRHAGKRMET